MELIIESLKDPYFWLSLTLLAYMKYKSIKISE